MTVESIEFATSVVIVSYNTREKLKLCLQSIEPHHEVIVVDNDSKDGSPEMVEREFPSVTLIRSSENIGFGPANNLGTLKASHELVLYLNSDAYPKPGAIEELAKVFRDPEVVAAGPMLLNLDGSLQNSTSNKLDLYYVYCEQFFWEKLFPGGGLREPYWTTKSLVARGGVQQTPQVMGAALMCRKGLELFDERYFLYCEDTDLCLRLSKHGKILYVPNAKVDHELGSSSAGNRWRAVARYNRGKELYFEIHSGAFERDICWLLDRLGALLRLLVWLVPTCLTLCCVRRFRSQVVLFWRVLFSPRLGPPRY